MSKICFNALSVHPGMSGIGHYARSLLSALSRSNLTRDFLVLKSAGHSALGDGFPPNWHIMDVEAGGPLWENLKLPTLLDEHDIELYHIPLFTAPMVKTCKCIITIHDAIPLTHPEYVPVPFQELFHGWIEQSLRACDLVVTTSEAAKEGICTHLEVEPERIRVVYQCVGEEFRPRSADEVAPVLEHYGLTPGSYLLYVGAIDRRKNIEGLLKAYGQSKVQKELGVQLAVVGNSADGEYSLQAAMADSGVTEGIIELGYVPSEDLPHVMAGAKVFAFPSFAEGFGRPVLEAMASGIPVVASDIPPLREVAGDTAEWVDPENPDSIAAGIRTVLLEDDSERLARREKVLARAKEFTAERFARETLAVYDELLGE